MANLLEFLVKINDMASGPLKQLGNNGQTSFDKISNSVNKFQGKLNTLGMNINQIDSKLNQLKATREISFDTRQIRRINTEIDQLQNKKDRLEGTRSGGGFGSILGIGAGFAAFGFFKEAIESGIGRQMDLTSLQTLVGTGPGNKLNEQLKNYAQKSIYGNEIFNEGKLLAGSGVKAGNVMPVLSMIGDIAMGKKDRMQSIALAFAEANSTGYLNGRQEMMMRTALFNPLESLSKMSGKSMEQLTKDMAHHRVSIDMLVKSMEYATGPMGRFYQMQKKLQETDAGKWTTFLGTLSMKMGDLGLALMPVVGNFASFSNALLNNQSALISIATAIGGMTIAWGAYTVATNLAAISSAALEVAAYWPLAVVGAVAGGIAYLIAENDKYGQSALDAASDTLTLQDRIFGGFQKLDNGMTEISLGWVDDFLYGLKDIQLHVVSLFERLDHIGGAKTMAERWKWMRGLDQTDADKEINQRRDMRQKKMDMLAMGLNRYGHKGISPIDIATGKYTATGGGNGESVMGEATGKQITGGGVRSITINIAKFQDKTEIHSATLKEGVHEIEEMLRDMYLRVINSTAAAIS